MNRITFDIETIGSPTLDETATEVLEQQIIRTQDRTQEDPEVIKKRLMATNPFLGEICVIGLKKNEEAPVAFYGNEKQILKDFWEFIKDFNGIFVSFNGIKFDVPFIITRSAYHNISPTNRDFLNKRRFSYSPHFDCLMVATDWGTVRFISLKQICEFYGIETSKGGEVVASNVAEFVAKGEIVKVSDYCKRDVIATEELYKILINYT